MSISLRSLYAKVAFMRPDLEETAKIGYAVQEAAREVCRRTFLARDSFPVGVVEGSSAIDMALYEGQSLLKLHKVQYTATGSEDVITLAPIPYGCLVGVTGGNGTPMWYAQQGNKLTIWPPCANDGVVIYTYSYVPTIEVDTLDITELAVTAIEARAESMLLRLPEAVPSGASINPDGSRYYQKHYQNLDQASVRERDYRRCIGNLLSISDYGETGDAIAVTSPFPGAP